MAILVHDHYVWENETPAEMSDNARRQEGLRAVAESMDLDVLVGVVDMETFELRVSGSLEAVMKLYHIAQAEGLQPTRVLVDSDEDYDALQTALPEAIVDYAG
ncbi:MAG: hypothetical protein WKF67_11440 [Rubrobacteraceae bacterium]